MSASKLALVTTAACLLAAHVQAQAGATVTLGRALTNFTAAEPVEMRQGTSTAVMAEHQASNERLRVYYTLDAGSFTTPGDWTYYLHTAGVTWTSTPKTETRKITVFLGGAGSWRSNGESWSAVGYRALDLFANVEWRPRDTRTLRTGYRLDIRSFPDSPALNQVEHTGFASGLLNLKTRTTLIGEVRAGFKSYDGSADAWTSAMPAVSVTTSGGVSGSGYGMGKGMGPSLRASQSLTSTGMVAWGRGSGESSRHLTLLGRVAQSLTDRTGLSVQYTYRSTAGGLPQVLVTTPALFFDDGVYDDPFASNAGTWLASLKHVTAGGTEFEATAYRSSKNYRAALALDATGVETSALRSDRIERLGAGLTQPLFASRTGRIGLSLDIDYGFTRSRSNDAFYRYSSHVIGAGITVSY